MLVLKKCNIVKLIRDTKEVDTIFGVAGSNDKLTDDEIIDNVLSIIKTKVIDVTIITDDETIRFVLPDSKSKLNVDEQFFAFTKPELDDTVMVLNFIAMESDI